MGDLGHDAFSQGVGRLVHAWNVWFVAGPKLKSRYVAYAIGSDGGVTWCEPKSLGKSEDPKTDSVIRHPIVELSDTPWLLPLADRTILYNPETGKESPFGDERNHGLTPIMRTVIGGRACPRTVEINGRTHGTIFYDIDAKQDGGPGVFFRTMPTARLGHRK